MRAKEKGFLANQTYLKGGEMGGGDMYKLIGRSFCYLLVEILLLYIPGTLEFAMHPKLPSNSTQSS